MLFIHGYYDWVSLAAPTGSCAFMMCPGTALPLKVHIVLSNWSLEIAAWSIHMWSKSNKHASS